MAHTVFMYGSSVTRDSLDHMEELGIQLQDYVARQSLISAMAGSARPEWLADKVNLESGFQQKAAMGDLRGSLPERLKLHSDEVDLVVLDLVDERGGVWLDDEGRVATNSLELATSGALTHWTAERRVVNFGTDEHFSMWARALQDFVQLVRDFGLSGRVVFLEARWADEGMEGQCFPFGQSKLDPEKMNVLSHRYFDELRRFSEITVLTVPNELCITTARHRWGIAPYHYIDEFYHFVARRISLMMGDLDDK